MISLLMLNKYSILCLIFECITLYSFFLKGTLQIALAQAPQNLNWTCIQALDIPFTMVGFAPTISPLNWVMPILVQLLDQMFAPSSIPHLLSALIPLPLDSRPSPVSQEYYKILLLVFPMTSIWPNPMTNSQFPFAEHFISYKIAGHCFLLEIFLFVCL